jgi:hypothetical protein
MPPITRRLSRARKIWIGVALCRAARGRSIALRQCCKAAVDVVASGAVGLLANRETWTVGLSPRRGCRNHSYYQNRKRQSTHPGRAFFPGLPRKRLGENFFYSPPLTRDLSCMGGLTFACACDALAAWPRLGLRVCGAAPGKPYGDRFAFLMASMAIKYVDTASISTPTANATPSTNITIISFHSSGYTL